MVRGIPSFRGCGGYAQYWISPRDLGFCPTRSRRPSRTWGVTEPRVGVGINTGLPLSDPLFPSLTASPIILFSPPRVSTMLFAKKIAFTALLAATVYAQNPTDSSSTDLSSTVLPSTDTSSAVNPTSSISPCILTCATSSTLCTL